MSIASEYSQYITQRSNNSMLRSTAEGLCGLVISYFGVKKDFVLLFDKQDHFVYCSCHYVPNTKEPTKPFFYIDVPQSFGHSIRKLFDECQLNDIDKVNTLFYRDGKRYSFDEYYNQFLPEGFVDKLRDAIKGLPPQKNCPVIVSGPLASNYSFLYVLQDKFEEVYYDGGLKKKPNDSDITPRCYFPSEMKQVVDLFEGTSTTKYTLENLDGKGIAIPLDEDTLNSTFWKNVTWRDVASVSDQIDGEIAGVPIRYVGLKLTIDGYRNIFLSIKNGVNSKTILLHNSLGIKLPEDMTRATAITETTNEAEYIPIQESETLIDPNPESQTDADALKESHGQLDSMTQIEPNNTIESQEEILASIDEPVEGFEGVKLEIDDKEIYSPVDLFRYCLFDNGGTTEICFRDAYLYLSMECLNVFVTEILSNLGEKLAKFRTFKIMTLPKEKIHPNYKKAENDLKRFEKNVDKIKNTLKNYNIDFTHEYLNELDVQGTHKRTMVFDNGWCIDMEGGLSKLYKNGDNVRMGVCEKTTLYYYNVKKQFGNVTPYAFLKKGKRCTVKVISSSDRDLLPEKLFRYYLLDEGGTSHIIMRDRYLPSYSNKNTIIPLLLKLIGFANVAHSANKEIKQINRITLFITKKNEKNEQTVASFEKDIKNYKSKLKESGVEFEIGELSNEDKDGDHKRCMIFEDNGWCIDMEGGIGMLYKNVDDMTFGRCQSTTLYYCKEKKEISL